MIKRLCLGLAAFALSVTPAITLAQKAPLHVLAFYSTNVETDHVDFAKQAVKFFADAAKRDGFQFESTTSWDDLNAERLKSIQIVVWLNDSAHTGPQRAAFQQYMEHGGGWFGFHFAAYNDSGTHWPWFVEFLGGAVFYGNSWPPLPATLHVDDPSSPITRHLPAKFISPANEWYSWQPNPRANKDVKVLLTLDPSNFPLGFKDTLTGGDIPVAWTNSRYRMVYVNMGHGDRIFSDPHQNQMFEDALLWLGAKH
ncbi:MAG: ThuA domain-containing protein [Terracidiphilus sp.]|jgi:type 1 glutamine amidotransferase